MTLSELDTLLDYQDRARDRLLTAAAHLNDEEYTRDLGSSFPSVRDTMVHIYSAEWVWCERWQGRSPTAHVKPDDVPDVAALRVRWQTVEAETRAILRQLGAEGIDREMEFRMLNGDACRQPFWHMLQHVVNHSSYHGGQVTTMMRQMKAAPPASMDLIAFYRERASR